MSIARNCSKIEILLVLVLLAVGGGAGAAAFVRSCVSSARNCGNLTIFYLPDEPFRKIVRVDRPKL